MHRDLLPLMLLAAAGLCACAVAQSPVPDAGSGRPPRDMLPPLDRSPMPEPEPEPELDAAPDPEPEPDRDAAPDPEPELDAAPDPEPEPDAAPEPEPDMAPEPDPDPEPYPWIIAVDDSRDENRAGTAGIDVCGLSVDCDGAQLVGVQAELILGAGEVCDGVPSEICGDTPRDRAEAALDDGANCDPGSSPSDYVSLGVSGQLGVRFERDLSGCTLTFVELRGPDLERYDLYLCQSSELQAETCLTGGPVATSDTGGPLSVDLPTP